MPNVIVDRCSSRRRGAYILYCSPGLVARAVVSGVELHHRELHAAARGHIRVLNTFTLRHSGLWGQDKTFVLIEHFSLIELFASASLAQSYELRCLERVRDVNGCGPQRAAGASYPAPSQARPTPMSHVLGDATSAVTFDPWRCYANPSFANLGSQLWLPHPVKSAITKAAHAILCPKKLRTLP